MLDERRNAIALSKTESEILIDHLRPEHWKLPARILFAYGWRITELLGGWTERGAKHEKQNGKWKLVKKGERLWISGLTPSRIDWEKNEVTIERLKNGLTGPQYLLPWMREALEQLPRLPDVRYFEHTKFGMWRALQQAGMRAGLDEKKCHAHAFRHGAGLRFAQVEGATVPQISAMLGHKTWAMTMKYCRITSSSQLSRKFL